MWADNISTAVVNDFGQEIWHLGDTRAREQHGLQHGVNQKNAMLIAATLEQLGKEKKQSASLVRLCAQVLQYAQKVGQV
jgi:hypothetical protein